MEIDPEVAELLGDLPPSRLPQECIDAEWGTNSMERMIAWGQQGPQPPTEGPQAPTFDHACVQCGRPVTMNRGHWEDHNAQRRCDYAIWDGDPISSYHVTDREEQRLRDRQEYPVVYRYSRIVVGPAVAPPQPPKQKKKEVNCSKTKHSHSCAHTCQHPSGHFGFHECRFCRHIWG